MCKLWYNIQVATYGPGSWLFPWLVCHNVEVRMRTETCIVRASEKKHVFPSAQLRLSLVLGGWLQIEKYPINVGFLAENLPGFFFFRLFFASLSSKKHIFFNRYVWRVHVWGIKYYYGFLPVFIIVLAGNVSDFYIFGIWRRCRQITAYGTTFSIVMKQRAHCLISK